MSIMWEPSAQQKDNSEIKHYLNWLKENYKVSFEKYDDFYNWSCEESVSFWKSLIEYYQVSFTGDLNTEENELKFLDYFWFPNAKLNNCKRLGDQILSLPISEEHTAKEIEYVSNKIIDFFNKKK